MAAAWRVGYLLSSGSVIGYFEDPGTYWNPLAAFAVVAFYVWIPRVLADVFNQLWRNGVVAVEPSPPSKEDSEGFDLNYFKEIEKFFRKRWWLLSLSLAIVSVYLFVLPEYLALVAGSRTHSTADPFTLAASITWILIGVYCVALTSIYIVLGTTSLRRLLSRSRIDPRFIHPDRAAGFSSLGKFAQRIGTFVVIVGVLLIAASLTRSYLALGEVKVVLTPDLLVAVALYLGVSRAVFLAPIWIGHNAMNRSKHEMILELSEPYQNEIAKLRAYIGGDAVDIQGIKMNVETMEKANEIFAKLPVWPVNIQTITRFGSTFLAPVAIALAVWILDGLFSQ